MLNSFTSGLDAFTTLARLLVVNMSVTYLCCCFAVVYVVLFV